MFKNCYLRRRNYPEWCDGGGHTLVAMVIGSYNWWTKKRRHNTDHSIKDRLCCVIIICEIHHTPQIIPRQGWKPLLLPCRRSWWSICESMSCRDGRAGPRGWLWYHPTNDSPRMKRFWQICNTVNKVNCSDYVTLLTQCFLQTDLFFDSWGGVFICQPRTARERPQDCKHWETWNIHFECF